MTAGESHGKALTVIIEGLPAGILIDVQAVDLDLARRQRGYGRGARMAIEEDRAEILSGVRLGKTMGSPVAMLIPNHDHEHWREKVTSPRPGHADLAGMLKYGFDDGRNVLERASARETASRVAMGALFKMFLQTFGIAIRSHTISVGGVEIETPSRTFEEAETSPLRCLDPEREKDMMKAIDEAAAQGDTLGGVSGIVATGVCPGLGTYAEASGRLDGQIAMAMLSIPSVKGVEIGDAFGNARKAGSEVHDEIHFDKERGFFRKTNRAGGLEGGMTNGEDLVVRIAVKPVPSLARPLRSVDVGTKEGRSAQKERADVCVVPAAGVVAEAGLARVIARAFVEKFGGDCLEDVRAAHAAYLERIRNV